MQSTNLFLITLNLCTTELYMIKYTFGEIFSSGGATLYKNPTDQTVMEICHQRSKWLGPKMCRIFSVKNQKWYFFIASRFIHLIQPFIIHQKIDLNCTFQVSMTRVKNISYKYWIIVFVSAWNIFDFCEKLVFFVLKIVCKL